MKGLHEINEGLFGKKKKETSKKIETGKAKYGDPDFKKDYPTFYEFPYEELKKMGKEEKKITSKMIPLLKQYVESADEQREVYEQMAHVEGYDMDTEYYATKMREHVQKVRDFIFELEKGIW